MKFKLLDLFSGIGGFSLGLERSGGFETVAFCEIEPYCRTVLRKHWPGVPQYDDIRTLTADTLQRDGITIDAICGGFPCQDVSHAGSRGGLDAARSGLWSEYARLIGELRPRYVIVENVPGLLSLGMGRVLGDLATLRYDAEWQVIPATAIGAFHERERVWIIAYPSSVGHEKPRIDWQNAINDAQNVGWETSDAIDAIRRGAVPALCREDHGVPNRMDRLKSLGNAVIPQIPELIGRAIMKAEGMTA